MGRILVVDDDPDILKLAEAVLSQAGHTVLVAEDAMRALECLNSAEFDLLLSDANMPHYSGYDLINTIRKNDKFKDISIAMLTGRKERKDIERAIQVGANDYIVKPLDPLILIQKVNALFEKRPAKQYPEIHLAGDMAKAQLRRDVVIETVSEFGICISTEFQLKPGMLLDLSAEFFKALDAEPPMLKVQSVQHDSSTGRYRAQLTFLGAREAFLQKIRCWLYSHGASHRAAA